jgi:Stealth protein CR2, conserved region 2/Stealth protein CR3, conserved region 3/Stealth protein CR4, conserved region 4
MSQTPIIAEETLLNVRLEAACAALEMAGCTYHLLRFEHSGSQILVSYSNAIVCFKLFHSFNVMGVVDKVEFPLMKASCFQNILNIQALAFKNENFTLVFCAEQDNGLWRSRHACCPFPEIGPALDYGGPYAKGMFGGHNAIWFFPGGEVNLLPKIDKSKSRESVPLSALEIDAVFMWVSVDDLGWRFRKAFENLQTDEAAADNIYRYVSRDELRYSMRSLERFAPWFRKIFVVTDQQVPSWLATNPKVQIIDHQSIFADTGNLPTYNSRAIAANLHHIDGLAEHFICFNDDVFLGCPVTQSDFYDSEGRPYFFYSWKLFDLSLPKGNANLVDAAGQRLGEVFDATYAAVPMRKIRHAPIPLRRSLMEEIETVFASEFLHTVSCKLRGRTDIAVPSMLFPYYGYATNKAVPKRLTKKDHGYVDTGLAGFGQSLSQLALNTPKFFCINATETFELDLPTQAKLMKHFLQAMFPERSSFEKT